MLLAISSPSVGRRSSLAITSVMLKALYTMSDKLQPLIKSEQFAQQPRGQAHLPDLELDQPELLILA